MLYNSMIIYPLYSIINHTAGQFYFNIYTPFYCFEMLCYASSVFSSRGIFTIEMKSFIFVMRLS